MTLHFLTESEYIIIKIKRVTPQSKVSNGDLQQWERSDWCSAVIKQHLFCDYNYRCSVCNTATTYYNTLGSFIMALLVVNNCITLYTVLLPPNPWMTIHSDNVIV